ncbi:unnamed protein product [Paramecium pentaurelia]|uniref:Uncharacterized protein n=1 Tax=Paramecium pentaurelia TaxID=43138 RepID=A0A8S1UG40_9CILI|nr:unnamed protein product [Paramecium pentaurelia]
MQNQQLGQKLSNISSMIQQYQPLPQNTSTITSIPPPTPQSIKQPQVLQSLINDQKQFQQDVSGLIAKLDQMQYQNSPRRNQPTINGQSQVQPFQTQPDFVVQPTLSSPSSRCAPFVKQQDTKKAKEQNTSILRQAEQLEYFIQANNELKKALAQSNNKITEQQKHLDQLIKQNDEQKQQLITNEQNKIIQQKQYNDQIQNMQISHQRELQQIKNNENEQKQKIESQWQQKYNLKSNELNQATKLLNNKINSLQKDVNDKQEQLNSLIFQTKELSNQLEKRVQDLSVKEELLSDKQFELERLQNQFNQALEKYEHNIKDMIQNHTQDMISQDQVIDELKQHNIILSQQIIKIEQQNSKDIENIKKNHLKELNDKLDEIVQKNLKEKQQIQNHYDEIIYKLKNEKNNLQQTKDQQQLFLEQKVQVLSQEYKTAVETVKKQQEKILMLNDQLSQLEIQAKNFNRENINQIAYLNQKLKEMSSIQPQNQNINYYYNELKTQNLDLRTQLEEKKEKLDELINNLNQVIEINFTYKTQLSEFQEKLSNVSYNNEKENEAYFNQIKQQKITIAELSKKVDQYAKNEFNLNNQIKELKNNIEQLGNLKLGNKGDNFDKEKELNKHLIQKTNEYKQQIVDLENVLQGLQEELQQKNQLIFIHEKTINELKKNGKEIKQQIMSSQMSGIFLNEKQVQEYESQIMQLKDETNSQKVKIESLQSQLKQVRKDKAHLSMTLMNSGMLNIQSSVTEKN